MTKASLHFIVIARFMMTLTQVRCHCYHPHHSGAAPRPSVCLHPCPNVPNTLLVQALIHTWAATLLPAAAA